MRAIAAADAMGKASVAEALARDSNLTTLADAVEDLRRATDSVQRAIRNFQGN